MKTLFVDTNVFLRYFLDDDKSQADAAEHLFEQARDGKVDLVVGPPVFFEAAWTLRSAYKMPEEKVIDILHGMAAVQGLKIYDRLMVEGAIGLAKSKGMSFPDCYIAVTASNHRVDGVATFNVRDFKRLGTHTVEPK